MAYRNGRIRRMVRQPVQPESPTVEQQKHAISHAVVQRAIRQPESLTPSDVMTLQRTIGNQAVQRLLGGEQAAPAMKRPAPPTGGRPLPPDVQAKMEDSFGTDFSNVRIHEGPQADTINARAYTQGNHIVFAQRQFDPHTRSGQTVLAHELAHVVQQRSGRVGAGGIDPSPALEMEAHRAAEKAANGGSAGLTVTKSSGQVASTSTIQRWPKWLKKIGKGIKNAFKGSGSGGDKESKPRRQMNPREAAYWNKEYDEVTGALDQWHLW